MSLKLAIKPFIDTASMRVFVGLAARHAWRMNVIPSQAGGCVFRVLQQLS
jgi:hypothetical protein